MSSRQKTHERFADVTGEFIPIKPWYDMVNPNRGPAV
jgi:hypothetical protein